MRKPTAKTVREVRERTTALARVQRPELLDYLVGPFWKAEALPAAAIKDAASRRYYHGDAGFVIPVGSLGRKGADAVATEADARSAAESIRLWIIKNLSDVIDPNTFAVVVDYIDGQWCVVVYRKK
jgi:hypothetical protein